MSTRAMQDSTVEADVAGLCVALNCSAFSFLASSGNAVYKVTSADGKCMYGNLTCNPKVSTHNHTNDLFFSTVLSLAL